MSKKEIEDLLETIKYNIPIEEYRSEGTSDGLCHYELDEDSWQYKTLEYIKNLQQENKQLSNNVNKLNSTLETMIKTNAELGIKLHNKEKELQQRESIIEEAIEFINSNKSKTSYDNMQIWVDELALYDNDCKKLLNILSEYKGDNNE